jgi:hypothetical protein
MVQPGHRQKFVVGHVRVPTPRHVLQRAQSRTPWLTEEAAGAGS